MSETVIVGYISGGLPQLEFTRSLASMTAYMLTRGMTIEDFPKLKGQLPKQSGPRIAHARNDLVKHFLELDADWLFMVDDDMVFDADALDRLLQSAHPSDRPIVGGLCYASGRDGYFPTLFLVSEKGMTRVAGWEPDKLIPVDATGAACLLVHRDVFLKMNHYPEAWPWFQETTFDGFTVGEDVTFCLRARADGFPIFVNTAVEFGHLKTVTVNSEFYRQWIESHRFAVVGEQETVDYVARIFSLMGIATDSSGTRRGWAVPREQLDGFAGFVLDLEELGPAELTGEILLPAIRAAGAHHSLMHVEEGLRRYGEG
jgi:GT2 family glycosyltransferase